MTKGKYKKANLHFYSFVRLFLNMNRFLQLAGDFLESMDQRADRSINGNFNLNR